MDLINILRGLTPQDIIRYLGYLAILLCFLAEWIFLEWGYRKLGREGKLSTQLYSKESLRLDNKEVINMDKFKKLLDECEGPDGYEVLSAERSADNTVLVVKYVHESILGENSGVEPAGEPTEYNENNDYLESLDEDEPEEPKPKKKKAKKKSSKKGKTSKKKASKKKVPMMLEDDEDDEEDEDDDFEDYD